MLGAPLLAVSPEEIHFNRDIRPLLSDKCFQCHGPDDENRAADLRLDQQETALEYAIDPSDPDECEVMLRILSDDPEMRMPPPESGKSLTPAEIELIRAWIESGAEYDQHWSFVPPERATSPAIDDPWIRNPIDAFVLQRMSEKGMSPSPAADKAKLIRRVSLDLIGLPPTLAEVTAFLADKSPDAYEKVVDRLLDSPRYGERMAQQWLDAARYADTMGYQADWERYQWRWRTWVIDAYNRNQPFDQFTIEQLAGDLLPNPTIDQRIATGFNRNHRINDEAGIVPEEFLVEYIVDRVETTSGTWLGLTMGCARCHDHKFDPISQADFYRMYAFFNSVPEKGKDGRKGFAIPYLEVAIRGKDDEYEKHQSDVKRAEQALAETIDGLESERAAWVAEMKSDIAQQIATWSVADSLAISADGGVEFDSLGDGSYLVSGENLGNPTYKIVYESPSEQLLTGLRLEAMTHPSLSEGKLSPGGGNFLLTNVTVEKESAGTEKPVSVPISAATADYEQRGYPVQDAIDEDETTGWGVDGHKRKEDRTAAFTFQDAIELAPQDRLVVRLEFKTKYPKRVIGRFRLALTQADEFSLFDDGGLPQDIVEILRSQKEWTPAQKQTIREHHGSVAKEAAPARKKLAQAEKRFKAFQSKFTTQVMVMDELEKPRQTHILKRGQYNLHGETVTAAVPADILGDLPAGVSADRLGLARWLVSGDHPLTGRVVTNRYWAMLFGRGLVPTVEDFGLQGEYPSNPALLDWLATEYPRIGWDTKALLKLIVTSATYRQDSRVDAESIEIDPHNEWLSRASRVRLPAEVIRDQALAAAGLLVNRIGGPSVKPYQPDGLWRELSFQDKSRSTDFYEADTGDGLYRRSLYTFWKRSVPPPTMATFDAPSREICTLQRSRTNTPLQALALMNDTTYVEASRRLAERCMEETTRIDGQIVYGFRTVLARRPDKRELKLLRDGYQSRLAFFKNHADHAKQLIQTGDSPLDERRDEASLAALTTVMSTILNLDETINRE